jgi:hypothetical protein
MVSGAADQAPGRPTTRVVESGPADTEVEVMFRAFRVSPLWWPTLSVASPLFVPMLCLSLHDSRDRALDRFEREVHAEVQVLRAGGCYEL